MTPEKLIVAMLDGASSVTALVGTRIHPAGETQNVTLPAIVYQLIADVPTPPLAASTGLNVYTGRVQVSCMGRTFAESRSLGSAVRSACHLRYGVIAGVQVVSCVMALRGPDFYDQSLGAHINTLDFSITYRE